MTADEPVFEKRNVDEAASAPEKEAMTRQELDALLQAHAPDFVSKETGSEGFRFVDRLFFLYLGFAVVLREALAHEDLDPRLIQKLGETLQAYDEAKKKKAAADGKVAAAKDHKLGRKTKFTDRLKQDLSAKKLSEEEVAEAIRKSFAIEQHLWLPYGGGKDRHHALIKSLTEAHMASRQLPELANKVKESGATVLELLHGEYLNNDRIRAAVRSSIRGEGVEYRAGHVASSANTLMSTVRLAETPMAMHRTKELLNQVAAALSRASAAFDLKEHEASTA